MNKEIPRNQLPPEAVEKAKKGGTNVKKVEKTPAPTENNTPQLSSDEQMRKEMHQKLARMREEKTIRKNIQTDPLGPVDVKTLEDPFPNDYDVNPDKAPSDSFKQALETVRKDHSDILTPQQETPSTANDWLTEDEKILRKKTRKELDEGKKFRADQKLTNEIKQNMQSGEYRDTTPPPLPQEKVDIPSVIVEDDQSVPTEKEELPSIIIDKTAQQDIVPTSDEATTTVHTDTQEKVPSLDEILQKQSTTKTKAPRVTAPSGRGGRSIAGTQSIFGAGAPGPATPGSQRNKFERITPKTEGVSPDAAENDSPVIKIEMIREKLKNEHNVDIKEDGTYSRGGLFGGNKRKVEKLLKTNPEFKKLVDEIVTLHRQT